MKTLSLPVAHRSPLVAALAIVLAAGLTRPPPLNSDGLSLTPVVMTRVPARPTPPAKPAKVLPFTMEDVVVFLSGNFQMQAVEHGADYARFIYTDRRRDGTSEEIMQISVRFHAERLQVAFRFREFNAMHYVAEFIEAPLFTRAESEQLYALLYAPNRQRAWQKVGRFHARAALLEIADGTEASFEFAGETPRG
jgi:hypothetical protein